MICGVTCEACGTPMPDETVARWFNMRQHGYHVVLSCSCGVPLTEARLADCVISTSRSILRGPTVDEEPAR